MVTTMLGIFDTFAALSEWSYCDRNETNIYEHADVIGANFHYTFIYNWAARLWTYKIIVRLYKFIAEVFLG